MVFQKRDGGVGVHEKLVRGQFALWQRKTLPVALDHAVQHRDPAVVGCRIDVFVVGEIADVLVHLLERGDDGAEAGVRIGHGASPQAS